MSTLLKRHPFLTSMASYAVLWTGSDIIQQKYISKHIKVNYKRTAKTVLIAAFYVAPMVCVWQRYIHKAIPGTHWKPVLRKVIREHLVFGPVVMSGFFTISHVVLDNNYNPAEIADEVIEKVPKAWMIAVPFWGSVQAVNLSFVPLHYRVHVTAVASFFWAIFLCYTKEKPYHHHHLEHGHIVEDDIVRPTPD